MELYYNSNNEEIHEIQAKEMWEYDKQRIFNMIKMLSEKNQEIANLIEEEIHGRCKLLFMITTLKGEPQNKWGFVFCDRDYFASGSLEDMNLRNCYM